MKNFKNELGDTNPERTTDHLEKEITEDTIEGYAYCATTKQKCLNDCGGGGVTTPFLNTLN